MHIITPLGLLYRREHHIERYESFTIILEREIGDKQELRTTGDSRRITAYVKSLWPIRYSSFNRGFGCSHVLFDIDPVDWESIRICMNLEKPTNLLSAISKRLLSLDARYWNVN